MINKLEKLFKGKCIHNLMIYVIGIYVMGYIMGLMNQNTYFDFLSLDFSKILKGEVWRLLTWIMYPVSNSFWFILSCYCYYSVSRVIEYTWGSFSFNLFFIGQMVLYAIASFIIYVTTGKIFMLSPTYINLSLFLSFALCFPDYKMLFFGIIPIKGKYLALIDLFYFLVAILKGFINLPVINNLFGGVSLYSNYYLKEGVSAAITIIFFAVFYHDIKGNKYDFNKKVYSTINNSKRKDNRSNVIDGKFKIIHKCHICGRTSVTNPELEFRYCSKCNGDYEYCEDHIYTHEHIK